MASIFNANPNQANAQFDRLVNELESIAEDNVQNGATDISVNDQGFSSSVLSAQNGVLRSPWVMSTTEWLTNNPPKALVWTANPSDISWSMPQRSVHSKNLFGTVLHVWPDNFRETFFDELRLTLNLQSSNIMPVSVGRGARGAVKGWVASPGLANFYDFMQLVDSPKLTRNGRANLVSIQYSSNLFPKLTLFGMFDSSGIRFTDSANNPNQVTSWSADFVVYDTAPRLSDSTSGQQSNAAMLAIWLDERVRNSRIQPQT